MKRTIIGFSAVLACLALSAQESPQPAVAASQGRSARTSFRCAVQADGQGRRWLRDVGGGAGVLFRAANAAVGKDARNSGGGPGGNRSRQEASNPCNRISRSRTCRSHRRAAPSPIRNTTTQQHRVTYWDYSEPGNVKVYVGELDAATGLFRKPPGRDYLLAEHVSAVFQGRQVVGTQRSGVGLRRERLDGLLHQGRRQGHAATLARHADRRA